MIRRRSLHMVVAWLAMLTAAGCQDAAFPTAVRPKATPRAPSYTALAANDVTYPVPHGTLRIYDQTLMDGDGNTLDIGSNLAPNARIRLTGKWEIGPITTVDDCPLCYYAFYIAGGPIVHGLVITQLPEVTAAPGATGSFDFTTHAPNEVVNMGLGAAFSVGNAFSEPTSYLDGKPTNCPTCIGALSYSFRVSGPTFEPVVTGQQGAAGWYTGNVSVSWSIDESRGAATGKNGCDPVTVSTDTDNGGWTSTCSVKSIFGTGERSVTIKRDVTSPALLPTVSPNPVVWNGSATASPNATDRASRLASQSCDAVNTSVIGPHTVTCTATDNAGNTNQAIASYVVISPYRFGGFLAPIDPAPSVNTAKAGAAIPVKFSLGGNFGLAFFAAGYPKWQPAACPSTPNDNPVDETATATDANALSYDARTDQYTYVWKSAKNWAGSCGDLVVRLADGSEYSARFQFKK